jgi:hypothetical protein
MGKPQITGKHQICNYRPSASSSKEVSSHDIIHIIQVIIIIVVIFVIVICISICYSY